MALKRGAKAINLDFKKAYDSISHIALLKILKHLKFPIKFINLIGALLSDSSVRIKINDSLSKKFDVKRGVKQGDPLSPLLFTFVVELLAKCANSKKLKNHLFEIEELNPKLKNEGLFHTKNGLEYFTNVVTKYFTLPLLMFADDTTLLSKSDNGIQIWLDCLKILRKATGLEINVEKTFMIRGPQSNCEIKNICEENFLFPYLGFTFNINGIVNDFEKKKEEVKKDLVIRTNPLLNIFEKLSIYKGYIASKLWFKGFLLGEDIEKNSQELQDFLWKTSKGGRKVRVSLKRAWRPCFRGGLGIWNLDDRYRALKANMLEKVKLNKNMKIYKIYKYVIDSRNLDLLMKLKPKKRYETNDLFNNCIDSWLDIMENNKNDLNIHNIEYLEVKDLQNIIGKQKKYNKVLLTEKQEHYKRRLL
jgi:hypothetical protein